MEGLTIHPLAQDDVEAVVRITRATPEAAQWIDAEFSRVARVESPEMQAWVADLAGDCVGFVVTRRAADEIEILNLAVEGAQRGKGIGWQLVEQALVAARETGAARAFLEVRESNQVAVSLYMRHGFRQAGRREAYYSAPEEAALILARDL